MQQTKLSAFEAISVFDIDIKIQFVAKDLFLTVLVERMFSLIQEHFVHYLASLLHVLFAI